MARQEQKPLPPAVNRLKHQVQKWRRSREGQFSITPCELWDAAVSRGKELLEFDDSGRPDHFAQARPSGPAPTSMVDVISHFSRSMTETFFALEPGTYANLPSGRTSISWGAV